MSTSLQDTKVGTKAAITSQKASLKGSSGGTARGHMQLSRHRSSARSAHSSLLPDRLRGCIYTSSVPWTAVRVSDFCSDPLRTQSSSSWRRRSVPVEQHAGLYGVFARVVHALVLSHGSCPSPCVLPQLQRLTDSQAAIMAAAMPPAGVSAALPETAFIGFDKLERELDRRGEWKVLGRGAFGRVCAAKYIGEREADRVGWQHV